jgi:BirA family biotin operon repressor/biotin-[acetyl-CoA-carboxylase] ligase
VGINVSQSGETIGVDTAISLAMAGIEVPHEQVVEGFLRQFGEDIGHLRSLASAQMLLGTYRQMSSTLGREVEIFADEQNSITGVALDINDDGHLMVDVDGDVRAFASGDVFHCRPVDQ